MTDERYKLPTTFVYTVPLAYAQPDPEHQADLDRRRAIANRDLPAALRRLDALTDRVSRAVLDLHRREPRFTTEWECAHCLQGSDMGDHDYWPCDTVQAVAGAHGIDLTDSWLLRRPHDGSLDQPPTPETL